VKLSGELCGVGTLRSDLGLTIPSVLRIAGVDDEVILEIEFVARAGRESVERLGYLHNPFTLSSYHLM
jgi:hypothetical protein